MSMGVHSAPGESANEAANAAAPPACEQTGIKALSAVARHLGLDWSIPRLIHVYGKEHEPDAAEIVRIAQSEGLKAKVHQTDWTGLERFRKLAPFLVRLKDGGYFIVPLTGPAQGAESRQEVLLFNPRVPESGLFTVSRTEFLHHWSGEVLLFKRIHRLDDTNRRFGLGWF